MEYVSIKSKENSSALEIKISGLHGGHSGDEIHKGYGNAIKILNEILLRLSEKADIALNCIEGGNLRNAIPREANAIIIVKKEEEDLIRRLVNDILEEIRKSFGNSEKTIALTIDKITQPKEAMDKYSMIRLLNAIDECPNGVINWSADMPGLVETSTNLAIIRTVVEDKLITIATSQRSSVESEKTLLADTINRCFSRAGMEVSHSDGYPGWKPDMKSFLLAATIKSYKKLFGKEPEVTAIHAGLECGLFYEKIKGIDMISIGPTIKGAHTTEERIEIKTVKMFWDLLIDILKNI